MITNKDFVPIAQRNMSEHGWVYYSTGSEDEETLRENRAVFQRYLFRPRVCVDVSRINTNTTSLGFPSSMPLFLCGAALQGLAHPDGEVGICRAAHNEGVIQMVPTFSSKSLEEIAAARAEGQVQFFQLYINSDRSQTERVLRKVAALGFKAVFVTVDAPKLGRREKDMRMKYQGQLSQHHDEKATNRGSGVAMALNSYIAANVTWQDIAWIKKLLPEMKIVVKGIQRGDDAVTAVTLGVDGLLLSNHGGRQIDTGRSGVEILVEVAAALRERGLFDKTELYVDGGIWRGNDIAKCLALGARAVGVGRATIFGLAAFGQPGAEKSLQIFRAELQNTMGLLGAPDLASITPDMVMERAGNSGVKIISRL
jgi:L-lactate dehydrogenase (cytochrome)